MKKILACLMLVTCLGISGCANFNPRNQQKIDNQQGKIEDIRNNQNGVMAEIGKLRQEVEIQNSKLKEIQNGLLNINAAVSRNENSGVQIMQGDGALIFIFAIIVIGMVLYYRHRAIKGEKNCEIMAKEVARFNNPVLNENILKSAARNNRATDVYSLLKKYVN
jgi:preprotein translocase subunit SecG